MKILLAILLLSAGCASANPNHGLHLIPNTGSSSFDTRKQLTFEELRAKFALHGEAILPGMSPADVQAVIGRPPTRVEHKQKSCAAVKDPNHVWCGTTEVYESTFSRKYIVNYSPVHGAMRLIQRETRFYSDYTKFSCSFVVNSGVRHGSVLCLPSYAEE